VERDNEAMPNPQSTYELRRHLASDHALSLFGLAWSELAEIHDQDHRAVTPDHGHERVTT
jgi:hypothetical protein